MFKPALAIFFILACALTALPQKITNDAGDSWLGKVTSVNVTTREITVTSLDKGDPESFSGLLDEDFMAWRLDDSITKPSASEIPVGMRVRLFYKTKKESVGGQKVNVNQIYAVYFIGRDDFDRLRLRLKLAPSTVVSLNQAAPLPASNPLKLYLSTDNPRLKAALVEWVEKWDKEQADKYGGIDLVSDPARADVSLVTFRTVITFSDRTPGSEEMGALKAPGTIIFLAAPRDGGLDVLWKTTQFFGSNIKAEMEKRMKARSGSQKN